MQYKIILQHVESTSYYRLCKDVILKAFKIENLTSDAYVARKGIKSRACKSKTP